MSNLTKGFDQEGDVMVIMLVLRRAYKLKKKKKINIEYKLLEYEFLLR